MPKPPSVTEDKGEGAPNAHIRHRPHGAPNTVCLTDLHEHFDLHKQELALAAPVDAIDWRKQIKEDRAGTNQAPVQYNALHIPKEPEETDSAPWPVGEIDFLKARTTKETAADDALSSGTPMRTDPRKCGSKVRPQTARRRVCHRQE